MEALDAVPLSVCHLTLCTFTPFACHSDQKLKLSRFWCFLPNFANFATKNYQFCSKIFTNFQQKIELTLLLVLRLVKRKTQILINLEFHIFVLSKKLDESWNQFTGDQWDGATKLEVAHKKVWDCLLLFWIVVDCCYITTVAQRLIYT